MWVGNVVVEANTRFVLRRICRFWQFSEAVFQCFSVLEMLSMAGRSASCFHREIICQITNWALFNQKENVVTARSTLLVAVSSPNRPPDCPIQPTYSK